MILHAGISMSLFYKRLLDTIAFHEKKKCSSSRDAFFPTKFKFTPCFYFKCSLHICNRCFFLSIIIWNSSGLLKNRRIYTTCSFCLLLAFIKKEKQCHVCNRHITSFLSTFFSHLHPKNWSKSQALFAFGRNYNFQLVHSSHSGTMHKACMDFWYCVWTTIKQGAHSSFFAKDSHYFWPKLARRPIQIPFSIGIDLFCTKFDIWYPSDSKYTIFSLFEKYCTPNSRNAIYEQSSTSRTYYQNLVMTLFFNTCSCPGLGKNPKQNKLPYGDNILLYGLIYFSCYSQSFLLFLAGRRRLKKRRILTFLQQSYPALIFIERIPYWKLNYNLQFFAVLH